MEKRCNLLPGVAEVRTPPSVVFQSRTVIVRARRRAAFRDVVDLLLLASVDALFVQWPRAHVPVLDRAESLLLLAAVNLAMVAMIWFARALPRWTARRVAATWSPVERTRLFNWLER
jgi:hypothetical protein